MFIIQSKGIKKFLLLTSLFLMSGIVQPANAFKLEHTLVFTSCAKSIYNVRLDYGKFALFGDEGRDFLRGTNRHYLDYMVVADYAEISWLDAMKKLHKKQLHLKSLLLQKERMIKFFELEFNICDKKLTVFYAKPTGEFEQDRKEIWPEQKKVNPSWMG